MKTKTCKLTITKNVNEFRVDWLNQRGGGEMALLTLSRRILSMCSSPHRSDTSQKQKKNRHETKKQQPQQEVNLMNMLTEITILCLLFLAWQLSNATIRTVKIASIAFNFSFCACEPPEFVIYCLVASFAICRMIGAASCVVHGIIYQQ